VSKLSGFWFATVGTKNLNEKGNNFATKQKMSYLLVRRKKITQEINLQYTEVGGEQINTKQKCF
jgi:hypothetical protein